MACIFHILFSFVLLFNVSTCQSKTKVEKANENMTNPMVSEPLTKPIRLNEMLDLTNPVRIETEKELKDYFIKAYQLPGKWEKRIKNVTVCGDSHNQLIAISIDNQDRDKEKAVEKNSTDTVLYLKEKQDHFPSLQHLNRVKYSGSPSISSNPLKRIKDFKNKGQKLIITTGEKMNVSKDKVRNAIVQHKKVEKFPLKHFEGRNIKENNDKKVSKIIDDNVERLYVSTGLKSEELHQHIREALLNSKEGAVIILHKEHTFPKSGKKFRIYVPEFKSRGFRLGFGNSDLREIDSEEDL